MTPVQSENQAANPHFVDAECGGIALIRAQHFPELSAGLRHRTGT
jgi:hypothetical protein